MEYEHIKIDADDLEYPLCQCDDCGYVGRDWCEPSDGSNRVVEDEAEVLCPKCQSWMYCCIPEPKATPVPGTLAQTMTTEQMIQLLLDNDIERFLNDDAPADYFASLRRQGFRGYEAWSDKELLEEILDREIIDREIIDSNTNAIGLCIAYATGYWDGRSEGNDNNQYDHSDPKKYYYSLGYESGVGDYCRLDETEEQGADQTKI